MNSIIFISLFTAFLLHCAVLWMTCLIVGLSLTLSELVSACFVYTVAVLMLTPPTGYCIGVVLLGIMIWRFGSEYDIVEKTLPLVIMFPATYFLVIPFVPKLLSYISL